jgi:hypothetical protein
MSELMNFKQATLLDSDVSFAIENGLWLNATQVAKTYGKRMDNYFRDDAEYIEELTRLSSLKMSDLKRIVIGKGKMQGTYLHPKLVMSFARWCNPRFAIACDEFITQSLISEQLAITKEKDKEIERLKAEKKLCNIYDGKWSTARGLVQHTSTSYSETEIKDFMYSMGLIEPVHKVTRFWKTTEKGLKSGLVKSDSLNTPIYEMEKTIEYMNSFKNMLENMKPIEMN